MADRSNIVVQDGDDRIWLYGHWMGCAAVEHAAHGLRSARYDDAPYLVPLIFDHMKRTPRGLGTGFGISARRYDNQHPVLVIDVRSRTALGGARGIAHVWFEDDDGARLTRVFTREAFLRVASSIRPWTPSWSDPGEHDCAYDHFVPSREAGVRPTTIGCGRIWDV